MLPRIFVYCAAELPHQHLWRWLRSELPGCRTFDLDQEGNLCLSSKAEQKKLSSVMILKSLAKTDPKVSIPLLYEVNSGLAYRDGTSTKMIRDLESTTNMRIGTNYVRWYQRPRRLAIDIDGDVSPLMEKRCRVHGVSVRRGDADTTLLWRFTRRLRRLLVRLLKEKIA